jgi:hypothetical protein
MGSAKNLREIVETQVRKNFTKPRAELEVKISELAAQEQACLESAGRILV